MKKIETVFPLRAFLPYVASKQKDMLMAETLKKNHSKSITCKKIKKFGGHFPISGNLPYVKGNKKYEKKIGGFFLFRGFYLT